MARHNRPIRRSQLIAPFGVGALVDFPGPDSLIICGLDSWPLSQDFKNLRQDHSTQWPLLSEDSLREYDIIEPRLKSRLGIARLLMPPDFRDKQDDPREDGNSFRYIPLLRFPSWHFCSNRKCGCMIETNPWEISRPICPECKNRWKMFQVRFVATCENGHLRDFPWREWVHDDPKTTCKKTLFMSGGNSASLSGILVRCDCGKKKTLQGAFEVTKEGRKIVGSALSKLGITCRAERPWVGVDSGNSNITCDKPLQAILRGSLSLYYPLFISSIYLPNHTSIHHGVEWLPEFLENTKVKNHLLEFVKLMEIPGELIKNLAKDNLAIDNISDYQLEISKKILAKELPRLILDLSPSDYSRICLNAQLNTPKQILPENMQELTKKFRGLSETQKNELMVLAQKRFEVEQRGDIRDNEEIQVLNEKEESYYRFEEFKVLKSDISKDIPDIDLEVVGSPVLSYEPIIARFFERISLVKKLRETRAFYGFSRINPTPAGSLGKLGLMNCLRREPRTQEWWLSEGWLPATVVRGEGLFFELNMIELEHWEKVNGSFAYERLRSMSATADRFQIPLEPRFVVLHTFAHLLMRELIFQCGYGSAALRERIYCSSTDNRNMAGILIYTSAGDSEGTMGGLVRMGQPGQLEPVIRRALDKARWCSYDPVCISSLGQGPQNTNRAACHGCCLIPETSCESGNRFLDRAMVIGTPENSDFGFFCVPENNEKPTRR